MRKKYYKAYQNSKPNQTKPKQSEETERAPEPDMAGMLERPDWEFKTPMYNVL